MIRETREASPDSRHGVSRRSFLRGVGGVVTAMVLTGCGIPAWNKEKEETALSPEQIVDRDFETYIRQVGNGIIERLVAMPEAAYREPAELRGINHTDPDDYYWRQSVDNDPVARHDTFELNVTLEYTENVTYRPNGYHVTMSALSPTSNGESGYFVQVDARPAIAMTEYINEMKSAGMSVIDIATELMRLDSGVDIRTEVMYCDDVSQTDDYGPSIGGVKLSPIDSNDYDKAKTIEEKRSIYHAYVQALTPLKQQVGI